MAGAFTMYWMGLKGTAYIVERYHIKQQRMDQAAAWFDKWGPAVLLLAAIPIIGDPLCLVAGSLRMKVWTFTFWVTIGKGWRYLPLLGAMQAVMTYFNW